MGIWGRFMTGIGAFRRAFLHPETSPHISGAEWDAWGRWDARRLRYQINWGLYCNDAFWDEVHRWSMSLKSRNGLYTYIRPNFNPIARLVEFHATHLVGGTLDRDAGDGSQIKSALPIETKSNAVRLGLSHLWRDSRWAIEKDVWARKGAALGDIALKGCDDPHRQCVGMEIVDPGALKWIDRDRKTGRVYSYLLEEIRYDPRKPRPGTLSPTVDPASLRNSVTYNEEAWIDGSEVVYRTYLNGGLFDWRCRPDGTPIGTASDAEPEWRVPYAFIPLVVTQHLPVGLQWGLAEGHTVVSKILELADVGSNLGDYIRRVLNDAVVISGVQTPKDDVKTTGGDDPTIGNPQPGRTKRRMLYLTDPNAKVQHLTQDLDVPGVSGHLQMLRDDVNEDYPELDMDLWKTGDPSGRALRTARQRAESKVQQRRSSYDESLVLMQRMCLAIGGLRGYEGYIGLGTEDPFRDPKIEHSIAHRPVFAPDPMDDLEEGTAFWTMVNSAVQAGMPLEVILRREGWPEADIAEVVQARQAESQAAVDQLNRRIQLAGGDTMGGDQ